jgi:hypothetical protein
MNTTAFHRHACGAGRTGLCILKARPPVNRAFFIVIRNPEKFEPPFLLSQLKEHVKN